MWAFLPRNTKQDITSHQFTLQCSACHPIIMIEGYDPVWQAVLGTLFTWGVTAAGSAVVFVADTDRKLLDASLGFSAGVMLAASYWSLLAPAMEMAKESGSYGADGEWAFIPAAVGFALGAYFVYIADVFLQSMGYGTTVRVDVYIYIYIYIYILYIV